MGERNRINVTTKKAKKTATQPQPAFWLVWRDDLSGRTPHYKHYTEDSARAEAERLARHYPGVSFYVLPASAFARADVNPVTWQITPAQAPPDAPKDDEVPF